LLWDPLLHAGRPRGLTPPSPPGETPCAPAAFLSSRSSLLAFLVLAYPTVRGVLGDAHTILLAFPARTSVRWKDPPEGGARRARRGQVAMIASICACAQIIIAILSHWTSG
jgi:hypothetical protein